GFIRWTSDQSFNADRIVDTLGNVPGEMIDYGAKALKPVENYIGNYLNLWDNIDNPKVVESWHAMNTWVRDIIPMAGAAYRQLINEFYKENRLMNGSLSIRGERVDLNRLRANLLNVIAETDHITPPCQSEGIMAKVGSRDQEGFKVHGGHIGIMTGSGAEKRTWPHIEAWRGGRSGVDGGWGGSGGRGVVMWGEKKTKQSLLFFLMGEKKKKHTGGGGGGGGAPPPPPGTPPRGRCGGAEGPSTPPQG